MIEAKLFEMGMENGYACYPLFSDKFLGFFPKNGYLPKANRSPAIETLEGWYEVEVVNIVTGVKGEPYPVEKEIFEESYEKVSE
ncbi:hypothetical protein [Bacillus haynesii]|uniref:hypothetical protein n=1 Tax=Bacillus haynesii TaxID=1925021 RepID=UPI00227DA45F|nr:hypothetical protein [Bacillus haynesii]MCY7860900.1 hypothetical protein [Bacillus haynesii]